VSDRPLAGYSVLLLEDEYFQAMESSALLERAGARVVGPAASEKDVHWLLQSQSIDTAVLDINLGRGASFEAARRLRDASVPFLFVTGYDQSVIPADLIDVPRVEKPATAGRVIAELAGIVPPRR
jgi:DNA-binding response OmpR family regulator